MSDGLLFAHYKSQGHVGVAVVGTQGVYFMTDDKSISSGTDATHIRIWKKQPYGDVYCTNMTSSSINSFFIWVLKYRYNDSDLIRKTLH